jgi:hypothetical protein
MSDTGVRNRSEGDEAEEAEELELEFDSMCRGRGADSGKNVL